LLVGVVELAARLGKKVRVTPACCSIAVGDEVMADGTAVESGVEIDLDTIVAEEARRREQERKARQGLGGIRIVTEGNVAAGGGCHV
jgi:hypothetical protein